jgi:hypothetical protein
VVDCKRYRDDIIHSVPFDIDKGIAHAFKHHTDVVQTLVTEGALNGLYSRMKLILDELREIDLLYRLADEEGAKLAYRREELDPLERRRTRDVPGQTARCQEVQKARRSLPPLPKFPDEDEAPSEMEDKVPHPRSEERDQRRPVGRDG